MKNPFDWQKMDWQKVKRKQWKGFDSNEQQLGMKIEKFIEGWPSFPVPQPDKKDKGK